MFENTERLLLKPAQQKIFMQILIEKWNSRPKKFVCGDASLCRVSVMLVVNFCRQWQSFTDKFSIKFVFSNTSRWLLLKLPRNNQSILTRLQVAEHHCISYRMFSNFSYVLLLPSVLTFSVLFSPHFCWDEVKFYSISVKRVMLILLGLIFPGIERGISVIHKISAV